MSQTLGTTKRPLPLYETRAALAWQEDPRTDPEGALRTAEVLGVVC